MKSERAERHVADGGRFPVDDNAAQRGRPAPGALASALAACLCLSWAGTAVQAQGPPASRALPQKTLWNKSVVVLPIQVDPRSRSSIREVELYVKDDPTRSWTLEQKAPPTQPDFRYTAPHDGEYWFMVRTVDMAGRGSPPTIAAVPPGLIVVIDTQPPQIEVRCLAATPDGQLVQCVINDANADMDRLKFEYQTGDKMWRPLEAVPGKPDIFCVPSVVAVLTGQVRVEAWDIVGNKANREVSLNFPVAAGPTLPSGPVPVAAHEGAADKNSPATLGGGIVRTSHEVVQTAPARQELPLPEATPLSPQKITPPNPMPVVPITAIVTPETPAVHAADHKVPLTGARQIVNSKMVNLEYDIDRTGPSGVGKVEIWLTSDRGQSWERYGEDKDHNSPAHLELPGEGLFGVSLVVTNGRGFGATPPAPGDAPDRWIEVDLTAPVAELVSVAPSKAGEPGVLVITWNARDKNLASEPIDLYYAGKRDGPWVPIAKGLKSEPRQYRWAIPQEVGNQAFVRLVVTDQARNVTQVDTPDSIPMDDGSRPRIRLVNVTTGLTQTSSSSPADR